MCGLPLKGRKKAKDLMLILLWNNRSIGHRKQCGLVRLVMCWVGRVGTFCEGHQSLGLKVKGRKGGERGHEKSRLRKKVWRLVWAGKTHFADHSGLLALTRLQLGWGQPGHPYLLGILADIKYWSPSLTFDSFIKCGLSTYRSNHASCSYNKVTLITAPSPTICLYLKYTLTSTTRPTTLQTRLNTTTHQNPYNLRACNPLSTETQLITTTMRKFYSVSTPS